MYSLHHHFVEDKYGIRVLGSQANVKGGTKVKRRSRMIKGGGVGSVYRKWAQQ